MRKRFFFLILLVFQAFPVIVPADSAAGMHRQSAFIFARRKMWNEAILHAREAHDALLVKYFTWEYLKDPGSDASFDSINRFIEENPGWPDMAALEKRAEIALMANNPSDAALNDWFSKHPPQTERTKLRNARSPEELRAMIRDAWVNGNYDRSTEEKILRKYHSMLRAADHIRRIDRLLWEGQAEDAKWLLAYVPAGYQRLFQARIALAQDRDSAPSSLERVPRALRGNPGLIYDRILWRMRDNNRDGVRELLLSVPAGVPYPEKWWVLRDRQIREALGEGHIKMAERLLARDGQKPDTIPCKEAQWLRGWIALEYHNSPEKAYGILIKLFAQVETPAGKARVAYWIGRASEKIRKGNPARWYGEASRYPTTFYGQLAAWELNRHDKNRHMHAIRSSPSPSVVEREHFRRQELVRLVYDLAASDQDDQAERFIAYITQNAKSGSDLYLATELGRGISRIDLSVRAAKKALQHNVVVLENGWPVIGTPGNIAIERPLLLALARQESEFYAYAVSPSGARGLLQLLPTTARETARRAGMAYSGIRLFTPEYNMRLGSIYMNKLVEKFGGSYLLAISGYNAGPNRVRQWVDEFGAPTKDVRTNIDWIEKIPTFETRNYVQHVMENVEVYRYLLARNGAVRTMIGDDLSRGG